MVHGPSLGIATHRLNTTVLQYRLLKIQTTSSMRMLLITFNLASTQAFD